MANFATVIKYLVMEQLKVLDDSNVFIASYH